MPRRIARRQSPIHGNGVFALRDIPKGSRVVEYRGRRLTHAEADRRYGDEIDTGHTFLFTLNDRYLVDGGDGGNVARWINHSCTPNLVPRIYKGHIIYMSLRAITPGEELTVDYNFAYKGDKSPCRCGAERCRGIMERLTPKLERELAREKAARGESAHAAWAATA